MTIKIKICGMRDVDNIREVSALQPDYMGFIFFEKSPRYVGQDFILPATFPKVVKRVGVFVNHTEQFVLDVIKKYQFNYAQLHGDETVAYCEALKRQGVSIIKVFRVDDDFDFESTKEFETVADYFLFDTKGKHYGGNAKSFDWNLLNQYNQAVPFFLSGGIKSEHINEIKNLSSLNIHAVDVNSGVENKPGIKSISKISEIINQLNI